MSLNLRVRTNMTALEDSDCPCISGSNIDSSGEADGWCVDAWCYVDPCTCKGTAKKSSYFPGLKTKAGKPVYYSYATCGSEDKFTCNSVDPTKRACPCNKDETTCGGGTNCVWQGGKCIGAELAGDC